MTRAKDQLHLMVPQRFFTHGQRSTGDRHVYAQRTRFIPSPMFAHFDNSLMAVARGWQRASSAHSTQWTCVPTCAVCGDSRVADQQERWFQLPIGI